MSTPTLVVAGVASDVGKTSVATGLMAALARAGHVVQGFKVGPDFIDPGYHAAATGRPGRNLDAFMAGTELIAPLHRHGCQAGGAADLAVVEGVMGMFDGASATSGHASTAHVARLLGAPVVLVVDAGAMARSAAAVVHGYATFDPDVGVAGVVFNRVGGPGHADLLREAVAPLGIPVLGCLPWRDDLATPSRHLGLVPVDERRRETAAVVDALAGWVAEAVDLEAVVALARAARPPLVEAWRPPVVARPVPVRVAVAGGAAFSFRYPETNELLQAAGAELVALDPLRDEALPDGTAALHLGGGFPEVYAEALAANAPLRRAVAAHVAGGGAVHAECGGLLYLCRSLDGQPMAGVVPADATMGSGLTIGYRTATAAADGLLGPSGTVVRGHEFHRSTVTPRHAPEPAVRTGRGPATDSPGAWGPAWALATADGVHEGHEGFVRGGVHASYVHTWWVATPTVAAALLDRAA